MRLHVGGAIKKKDWAGRSWTRKNVSNFEHNWHHLLFEIDVRSSLFAARRHSYPNQTRERQLFARQNASSARWHERDDFKLGVFVTTFDRQLPHNE